MTKGKATYTKTDKKKTMDEASMITGGIWFHLIAFKRMQSDLLFVVPGDRHQSPNIETVKYDFNAKPATLELTCYSYTELTKITGKKERG